MSKYLTFPKGKSHIAVVDENGKLVAYCWRYKFKTDTDYEVENKPSRPICKQCLRWHKASSS